MGAKFVKRIASELTGRGENAIRLNSNAREEIGKALTRDDVRKLIKNGSVFALKERHNISLNSKDLRRRRSKGRGRGQGRRHGSAKARLGRRWKKKIRSQRLLLGILKSKGKLDRQAFKHYYALAKGNSFADKSSLLLHMSEEGIKLSESELKEINEEIKKAYKAK